MRFELHVTGDLDDHLSVAVVMGPKTREGKITQINSASCKSTLRIKEVLPDCELTGERDDEYPDLVESAEKLSYALTEFFQDFYGNV